MLRQDAVYWGPPVDDGDGGFTWPDPVEISCRWETVEGAAKDVMSHEVLNNSTVYVDRDVEVNGYLYFGSLSDVEGFSPDEIEENAHIIKGVQKLPNIRVTEFLRVVTV